jgi:hypothetical protein
VCGLAQGVCVGVHGCVLGLLLRRLCLDSGEAGGRCGTNQELGGTKVVLVLVKVYWAAMLLGNSLIPGPTVWPGVHYVVMVTHYIPPLE